jgi:predicted enzyme related to lactoylglutathione lyase
MGGPRMNTPGRNVISWFEIPVKKVADAIPFYLNVFGANVIATGTNPNIFGKVMGTGSYANNLYGILVEKGITYQPNNDGHIHYFEVADEEEFCEVLGLVKANGGSQISQPSSHHVNFGSTATFFDNQGNKMGIHTMDIVAYCPKL